MLVAIFIITLLGFLGSSPKEGAEIMCGTASVLALWTFAPLAISIPYLILAVLIASYD